ncbi:MAG: type I restriction enzyme HsdR N-terminal domain-containing protein [Thermodesulfobacteriota bacterium]
MADVPRHHLEYGWCQDYITGETVVDTDDERIRQGLARLLVEERGYARAEVGVRLRIETLFAGTYAVSRIDFVVGLAGRQVMVIRYGPGSIVTRERPAVAAARVVNPEYQIPLAVATNGRDASLLDTRTGKVLAEGLAAIPGRQELLARLPELTFPPLPAERRERELRILNAYDVEVCCSGGPCALPGAREG